MKLLAQPTWRAPEIVRRRIDGAYTVWAWLRDPQINTWELEIPPEHRQLYRWTLVGVEGAKAKAEIIARRFQ